MTKLLLATVAAVLLAIPAGAQAISLAHVMSNQEMHDSNCWNNGLCDRPVASERIDDNLRLHLTCTAPNKTTGVQENLTFDVDSTKRNVHMANTNTGKVFDFPVTMAVGEFNGRVVIEVQFTDQGGKVRHITKRGEDFVPYIYWGTDGVFRRGIGFTADFLYRCYREGEEWQEAKAAEIEKEEARRLARVQQMELNPPSPRAECNFEMRSQLGVPSDRDGRYSEQVSRYCSQFPSE
jgi:hypothetical protein